MTDPNVQSGILEILELLQDDDLFALARTVTQGLLKIKTRDDAIRGILKYSSDEINILRRKAVTREILFSYLDEKNIPVKLPTTKNDLIDEIIKFWNISSGQNKNESNSKAIVNPEEINKSEKDQNSVDQLAVQFSQWFYSLMNEDEVIGTEHFFPDAKLVINIYSNDKDCDTRILENNTDEIVQALFQFKSQQSIFFNPNISTEGIRGRMDPHGLVLVLACGTLHVQQACVGIFEQAFALARDPFCENNWKVKNTELHIKSKRVVEPPVLSDSGQTCQFPMLPPSS